jgi:hypothetical protein
MNFCGVTVKKAAQSEVSGRLHWQEDEGGTSASERKKPKRKDKPVE